MLVLSIVSILYFLHRSSSLNDKPIREIIQASKRIYAKNMLMFAHAVDNYKKEKTNESNTKRGMSKILSSPSSSRPDSWMISRTAVTTSVASTPTGIGRVQNQRESKENLIPSLLPTAPRKAEHEPTSNGQAINLSRLKHYSNGCPTRGHSMPAVGLGESLPEGNLCKGVFV